MAQVLIDSNVLVYTFDQNEPRKQEQAVRVLGQLSASGNGLLSVQCLAEFASVSLRRLRPPLSAAEAADHIERFAQTFHILNLTAPIVIEAARGVRDHKLSYYDAQLWATARLNQIPTLFSEDFASNTSLAGVRFVNPFAEDFDLAAWV